MLVGVYAIDEFGALAGGRFEQAAVAQVMRLALGHQDFAGHDLFAAYEEPGLLWVALGGGPIIRNGISLLRGLQQHINDHGAVPSARLDVDVHVSVSFGYAAHQVDDFAYDGLMATAPYIAAMHDQFPESIEEEVELLDLDLAAYVLEWHARVPGWRDTYLGLDQSRHYRYLRTVLQALTFLRGPRTWVLKSPQHAEQLGPLMATCPVATVAFTHRDPVAVIQSAATMMAYSDRLRRHSIEPQWLIEYWTDRVHRLLSCCVRDRDLVPAERSLDIGFHQLNGNEMPVLAEVYRRAGVDVPPSVGGRFQGYIDSNRRGAKGAIPYDLQRHFGVAPDELRSRFDFYFDRFDVRPEAQ
jgi:hypothetical protein